MAEVRPTSLAEMEGSKPWSLWRCSVGPTVVVDQGMRSKGKSGNSRDPSVSSERSWAVEVQNKPSPGPPNGAMAATGWERTTAIIRGICERGTTEASGEEQGKS